MPLLAQFVTEASIAAASPPDHDRTVSASTDSAFAIWRQTVLARARLTSDVELYNSEGALVSRFALNFPEYTSAPQKPPAAKACRLGRVWRSTTLRLAGAEHASCRTEGLRERLARRRDCRAHRLRLPDVALPHVAVGRTSKCSGSPARGIEGTPAGDVDFTVYGWGLTAIYTSGTVGVALDEATFARVYGDARAVLDVRAQGDIRLQRLFLQRPAVDLRAGLCPPRPVRSLRPPRRTDDARGGRLRAHSDRRPRSSRWSPVSGRRPGGRSSVRFAPASIASCFWRSCWRRSCRS